MGLFPLKSSVIKERLYCFSEYETNVSKAIQTANKVYQEFLDSEKGAGFCGQVAIFNFCFDNLEREKEFKFIPVIGFIS